MTLTITLSVIVHLIMATGSLLAMIYFAYATFMSFLNLHGDGWYTYRSTKGQVIFNAILMFIFLAGFVYCCFKIAG